MQTTVSTFLPTAAPVQVAPLRGDATAPSCCPPRPRLLVVPGLHGSGPDHWQSWLQRRTPGSRRVEQQDGSQPDLDAWAARIGATLEAEPPGPWIAVAHSFGALALVQHLLGTAPADDGAGVVSALLVAPASPVRFGVGPRLARRVSSAELLVLTSGNDPWLPTELALTWAHAWGARLTDLGDLGHVNPASGFGPWPQVLPFIERLRQRQQAAQRARAARPD
ncbi:MAG: alpha/beta hydrolase [Rubrivivax sp.]|nr:alpha/beta hydrolase [Rubrivivax sp.]